MLRLVGVSRADVLTDYLLTSLAERQIVERLNRSAGRRHRSNLPASFFDVSHEAIGAVLDVWDDHPGGAQGWFFEVGGTPGQVDQLRRTLLT